MFTKEDIQEILEQSNEKILKIYYGDQQKQIAYITHESNIDNRIVKMDNVKSLIVNHYKLSERYLYAKYSYISNNDKRKAVYGEYILYSDIRYIHELD